MAGPVISVIITVYEQPASLSLLLSSLEAQDFGLPFEVLVCDDGSSDRIFELCRRETVGHRLGLDLRYIWQPKCGYRAARSKNNAIRCARGAYLVFLDADIVVRTDYLTRHLKAHSEPKMIVCNPRRWLFPEADSVQMAVPVGIRPNMHELIGRIDRISRDVERPRQIERATSTDPWMACAGFSFSVDNDASVRFDEQFEGWGPEDRELALRLVTHNGYAVCYCDDIIVYHLEQYSTGRQPGELLPRKAENIVAYLRNMLYFRQTHPDCDLTRLFTVLFHYELDDADNLWHFHSQPRYRGELGPSVRAAVDARIAAIKEWLDRHSRR
jgi:glycosyltransferase involved in cell wall biosynthesis